MTLLFDLDGTLVDCKELHFLALNHALALNGYKPISDEEHNTIYDGLPTQKKLEMLKVHNPEKVNEDKQTTTLRYIPQTVYPDEQVVNSIRALSQEYTLFCVSNSKRKTIEGILKYAGLLDYFTKIISCEDVKEPKPAPDVYLEARRQANDECIAFEDNMKGILAAYQANIKCFHVIDSSHIRYEHITNLIKYA